MDERNPCCAHKAMPDSAEPARQLRRIVEARELAMPRRTLLAALAASVVMAVAWGCGGGDHRPENSPPDAAPHDPAAVKQGPDAPSTRGSGCPVTPPDHSIPPGQSRNPGADRAPYYGNGRLWTVLPPNGTVREPPKRDGSIQEKFPWWRGVGGRGRLTIAGRRLDAPAPPLRASIPGGYGLTDFQASGIIFPTAGCWSVTGAAGTATLSFVTLALNGAP
jgi:hypothetical protein